MSLSLARLHAYKRILPASESSYGKPCLYNAPKGKRNIARPLSASYTVVRPISSSRFLATKGDNIDLPGAMLTGNRESVRAAYRAKLKNTSQGGAEIGKQKDQSETTDTMEDILDAALPGRKRSKVPDLGDVHAIKAHFKEKESDLKLSDLIAAEAEEDRAWARRVMGEIEEEEEEWDGFGADAPVKVPAEVFELNAQAQFCFLKEEFAEAQDYLEQSLALIRSRLGEKHNEAATVMVSLAQVLEKTKDFSLAESYLQDAIKIRKQIDGASHTSVAVALNKLAHVQTCQKKFDEALTSSKKASRIIQDAQTKNEHELSYYVKHQLDIPEALVTQRRALQTEAGQILNTRGAIHFKMGDNFSATEDWNEAIKTWSPLLVEADSLANPLFAVHRNLVHLYKQKHDMGGAISTAQSFIRLLDRHQPNSPLLPSAHLYLSQIYEYFQLWSDAWKQADTAYKSSLAINGPGEETDDLNEAVQSLSMRVRQLLGHLDD